MLGKLIVAMSGFLGGLALAGQLEGRILHNGTGVPGAVITLTGPATASTTSGAGGAYTVTVADGTYTVRITMAGFETIEEAGVAVSGRTKRDFSLQPAQYEEMTVVSSSKIETRLIDSPATISVIPVAKLENSANTNFGDVLRELPGVNVVQFSARDINVTAREETSSLANTQLTLLDGRTIYLDFFGIVLWDFMPANSSEIKQIEVVRGPASAIWGANAQTGLVNIITKTPRELQGTTLSLSYGTIGRDIEGSDLDDGNSYGMDLTHAGVVNSTWSYKVSAGYFDSDAWARPVGTVPFDPERGTGGFPYPAFENTDTFQPKLDIRFDQELGEGERLIYAAGTAETEGIIHSGIGPFDIQSGSRLSYGKVSYERGALSLKFFANLLDGEAVNLLTADTSGNPINFIFKTDTYDFEVGHVTELNENHVLSYGGNVRFNQFDLSLAPGEDERNEYGAYLQDEMVYGTFRGVIGARFDKFDSIDDVIVSPRITLMYQPSDQHTVRLSYNEAFRAPSLIENYLNLQIVSAVLDLGLIDPSLAGVEFPIITDVFGNRDLVEDSLEAYELGYTGIFGETVVGIAAYRNDTDDNLNFTNPPGAVYNSQNPPPGWFLPPQILDLLLAQGIGFPSFFTYLNLGPVRYQGLELSLDHRIDRYWDISANYSWQDEPEIQASDNPFPEGELSAPPTNRYNLSIGYSANQLFGRLAWSHSDEFFSTDVLDSRFHGQVDAYDMLNLNLGYRFLDNRVSANLKIVNLTDEEIQQHIFADVMKRNMSLEVRVNF